MEYFNPTFFASAVGVIVGTFGNLFALISLACVFPIARKTPNSFVGRATATSLVARDIPD